MISLDIKVSKVQDFQDLEALMISFQVLEIFLRIFSGSAVQEEEDLGFTGVMICVMTLNWILWTPLLELKPS